MSGTVVVEGASGEFPSAATEPGDAMERQRTLSGLGCTLRQPAHASAWAAAEAGGFVVMLEALRLWLDLLRKGYGE